MGTASGLVRYEVGDPRAVENGRKGGRPRKPRASEVLQAQAEAEADAILQPYIEALSARPEDWWSPATKLDFYLRQVTVAEKLLDRVFGRPIGRDQHQHLDTHADGLDDLPPEVVVRLITALAAGQGHRDASLPPLREVVGTNP